MSIIDTLITDRTQADVSYVARLAAKGWSGMTEDEKSQWLMGLKGAYNASDLNRVNSAMSYLVRELYSIGYDVPGYKPGPVWSITDVPTDEQMQQYLNNVSSIKSVLHTLQTTPSVPDSMYNLTYGKANNIEKILEDVSPLLNAILISFVRSNITWAYSYDTTFYALEETMYLADSEGIMLLSSNNNKLITGWSYE